MRDLGVFGARELANDFQARHWVNSSNHYHVVKPFRGSRGFAEALGRGCIEVRPNHSVVRGDVT